MSKKYISSPTEDISDDNESLQVFTEWPNFPIAKIIDFSTNELPESGYASLLYYMLHGQVSGTKMAAIKDILEVFFANERKLMSLSMKRLPPKDVPEASTLFENRSELIKMLEEQWK